MAEAQSPLVLIRRITVGLLVVCALVSLAIVWVASRRASPIDAQALASRLDAALPDRAATQGRSLVVLPFTSADEASSYIAFGLGDAIAAELQRDRRLRISGRQSAHSVTQTELGIADIGRVLNVAYVLRGSVARDNGRLTVDAALWDARTGQPRWEQRFEPGTAGLQDLVRRIGMGAAETIIPGYLPRMAGPQTDLDPEAYQGYQRAVYLSRRHNAEDLRRSIELLDNVLALEPDYADAIVQRLRSYSALQSQTGEVDAQFLAQSAAAAVDRLTALDPQHPDALMMRLQADLEAKNWQRKIELLRQAVDQRPSDPTALRWLAHALVWGGYLERGAERAREAAVIDPVSAGSHEILAQFLLLLGDDDRVLRHARLAEELGITTAGFYRGLVALRRGEIEDGIADLRHSYEQRADFDFGWLDAVAAALADPARRAAAVRTLDEVDAEQTEWMDEFMIFYPLLGDLDCSIEALHANVAYGMWGQWSVHLWLPELSAVRSDPRFGEIIAALELDRLWDAEGPPDRCYRPAEGVAYRCH